MREWQKVIDRSRSRRGTEPNYDDGTVARWWARLIPPQSAQSSLIMLKSRYCGAFHYLLCRTNGRQIWPRRSYLRLRPAQVILGGGLLEMPSRSQHGDGTNGSHMKRSRRFRSRPRLGGRSPTRTAAVRGSSFTSSPTPRQRSPVWLFLRPHVRYSTRFALEYVSSVRSQKR